MTTPSEQPAPPSTSCEPKDLPNRAYVAGDLLARQMPGDSLPQIPR